METNFSHRKYGLYRKSLNRTMQYGNSDKMEVLISSDDYV